MGSSERVSDNGEATCGDLRQRSEQLDTGDGVAEMIVFKEAELEAVVAVLPLRGSRFRRSSLSTP